MRVLAPERLGGQGIDHHQEASANRAILHLLTDPVAGSQVDLVLTWRDGAYEVWSARGLCRFRRLVDDAGAVAYEVVEVVGEDPIANQDPLALRTLDAERKAAADSGFDPDDPARRFIAPDHQSYPFAYERIAQLFDSPHAPDLAVSPRDWCSGSQPGQHGALHVRQARAPLWLSGPGVRVGRHAVALRSVDIAPTCLAALDFPLVDGVDGAGRPARVYLARQDGAPATALLDPAAGRPERLYVFLLDGLHQTELEDRLERDPSALPNLRRLRDRAAVVEGGSIVNFPSITWPSHTAIVTGAWCGHHDVVNPSYYVREERAVASPQGQMLRTEGFASPAVESLYEAFHRVDPACVTAAINAPFGRSARHADLEGRQLCDKERLKARTAELAVDEDPRWAGEHPAVHGESVLDTRGLAQVLELLDHDELPPPRFVYHELALTDGAGHHYGPHDDGLAAALDESDRRIGRVLAALDEKGLFEGTLFVVTADHGMAPQDVALRANPAERVKDAGLAAVVAEPMIWLLDVAVTVERAADRRTARVTVADDPDPGGERPPVPGASVVATGADGTTLASGATNDAGAFGFATPSDLDDGEVVVTVSVPGRNPRRLRLDGREEDVVDLRAALYGTA